MDNIKYIVETIQVGLFVAGFLQRTERNREAIELCKECLILLNSSALGIEDQFTKLLYRNVYVIMFNVACVAGVQRGERGEVECEREARSLGARRERLP